MSTLLRKFVRIWAVALTTTRLIRKYTPVDIETKSGQLYLFSKTLELIMLVQNLDDFERKQSFVKSKVDRKSPGFAKQVL